MTQLEEANQMRERINQLRAQLGELYAGTPEATKVLMEIIDLESDLFALEQE